MFGGSVTVTVQQLMEIITAGQWTNPHHNNGHCCIILNNAFDKTFEKCKRVNSKYESGTKAQRLKFSRKWYSPCCF